MKKLELKAVGSDDDFHYIILKKDKNFFQLLSQFLKNSFGIELITYDIRYVKKKIKETKRKINSLLDIHEYYRQGKTRIDIFYGKKTVFISIKNADKKKFASELEKISKWRGKYPKKDTI
jgi:hypothetical protein